MPVVVHPRLCVLATGRTSLPVGAERGDKYFDEGFLSLLLGLWCDDYIFAFHSEMDLAFIFS